MRLKPAVLILLLAAACAPMQALSQATQVPIGAASSTDTPEPAIIETGTPMILCPCPSGAFPPGPSQGAISGGTPVICNCPAILLPATIPVTEVGPTSASISPSQVTLDDNGKTLILHTGDSFLLNLGIDTFDWTVTVDNQNVLSREKNIMVIRGAQGVYQADNLGQAILTAIGDPLCRNSVPACAAPSLLFKITVTVQ